MTCIDDVLDDVYDMSCVDDAVMLYSVMLFIMLIYYCMIICGDSLRAGLLFIIGRNGPLRPGGSVWGSRGEMCSGAAILA